MAGTLACWASPFAAQSARELQIQAVGAFATERFVGGGLGFALRSAGRARVGIAVSAGDISVYPEGGDWSHRMGGRGELMASYHVNPYRRSGFAPYAAGGLAVTATSDEMKEYVLLLLGVEAAPWGSRGWFAELGIGGGVRVAAGYRFRWR